MNFTFGIITSPGTSYFLQRVTDSICNEQIPEFEIIIVGGNVWYETDVMKVLPFDETKKPLWITRKKNIITENAKYDNIVYLHDYVVLEPGWYKGFEQYGDNFNVCMNPILNLDGSRFRDWTLLEDKIFDISIGMSRLLPYNVTNLSKYMYISGAYWVAKKEVMNKFPFDESLSWGNGEDIRWSDEVRKYYDFSINIHSKARLLKQKDPVFSLISNETLQLLQQKLQQAI